MRKGLMVALSVMAITVMSYRALAEAPTITEMPGIIIGDGSSSTDSNLFVFPDAIDLDAYVEDDFTTDGGIQWSYMGATDRYLFNGVDPIVAGVDSVVVPGDNDKRIDTQDLDTEEVDGNPSTITVRDSVYSPLGGPNTDPVTVGFVASDTVTLYASDGTAVTSTTIIVYTDNDGDDRLSPETLPELYFWNFAASQSGAQSANVTGSATASWVSGEGICVEVTAAGDNSARWFTEYDIELVEDAVWLTRLEVDSNVTTVGQVPLWSVIWEQQAIMIGGETSFLDQTGGATAAASYGRNTFYVWLAPPSVLTPQYSGNNIALLDPLNDFRLIILLNDAGSGTYGAAEDAGRVCWSEVGVTRLDITQVTELEIVENITNITDALSGGNYQADIASGSGENATLNFTGGNLAITPTDGNWNNDIKITVRPGDKTADPGSGTAADDNWPYDVVDSTNYLVQYELSAPSAAAVSEPPDVFWFGYDTPTYEQFAQNYITGTVAGTNNPATGTPQPYIFMFYSHEGSRSTITPVHAQWRPFVVMQTSPDLDLDGRTDNRYGATVHGVKVSKVTFPGLGTLE